MFANKRDGTCACCGVRCVAGSGWCDRQGDRWVVSCRSSICLEKLGLGAPAARKLLADGRVLTPFPSQSELMLLRAMPGARWSKEEKCWRVSLDVGDRQRVLELAEKLHLDVAPELLAASESDSAERRRLLAAGLYPFQVDGVLWLRGKRRALLGDSMGLGKTVQVLLALPLEAEAAVVCPASLKGNWAAECRRWRPDLRPVIIKKRGQYRGPTPGEVVIVNYDILPSAPEERGAEPTARLDGCILVVDEASLCKSSRAKRAKAVRMLAATAQATWLLSGTPLENRAVDLWGTLRAGGLEREVFGGWGKFTELYGAAKNRWGGWVFGSPSPEVPERLRRVMLRRTKEEVLPDLPKIRYQHIPVEITDEALISECDSQMQIWDEERETGRDELPDFRQMSRVRQMLATAKLPAMLEIVEQYEETGTPIVVFSDHRAPIDELAKREGWAAIEGGTSSEKRTEIVAKFQAGQLKGLGLTIAAGGYGLTLTRASHVLFVDRNWRPALNLQAQDRVRRIGQDADSILVMLLVVDHALDRRVAELLDHKQRLIYNSIEAAVKLQPKAEQQVEHETEEQWRERADRLNQAARAQDQERARGRVRSRLAEASPGPIEGQLATEVQAAWSYLCSVCDGAETKDGQGFSKPDVALSRAIEPVAGEPETLLLCWQTLRRYHRQLKDYPTLIASWRATCST